MTTRPGAARFGSMCTVAPSASASSFCKRARSGSTLRALLAACAFPDCTLSARGARFRAPTASAPRLARPRRLLRRRQRQQRAGVAHVELARPAAIPAPASAARAAAADCVTRCATGRPLAPPLRASGRTRRSAADCPALPRADSDPRAGCSRSAPAPGPFVRARRDQRRNFASPARCAARQRRSPAMISKRSPSIGRTRIGCMMPCSRIDCASSSSDASSIRVRG